MLTLDLNSLGSDERFQLLCFRLARKQFPRCIPVAFGSWDGGRDIINFSDGSEAYTVWQSKFTPRGLSGIKPRVKESLDSLDPRHPVKQWVLCVSAEQTGDFIDWLRNEMKGYKFIKSWEIWDKTELLLRLEKAPEVLETMFYRVWSELAYHFRSDDVELVSFVLDDSDVLLDVIVRNRGTIDAVLIGGKVEVANYFHKMHGVPTEGLLFPKFTYKLSLHSGRVATSTERFDPPLVIPAGKNERFKLRLTETGYAWYGDVSLTLDFGSSKLRLPWIRIQT